MNEKTSLLISAGLAALGWLVTHYVDRLTAAATVEYRIETEGCTRGRPLPVCVYSYRLTNLNRTTSIDRIQLNFLKPGAMILCLEGKADEPADEGDAEPRIPSPGSATYEIPKLMPGASFVVVLCAVHGRPIFSVRSPSTFRLSHRNLETRIARNEMAIMSGLVLLWGLLLVIMFLNRGKGSDQSSTVQNHVIRFEK
jgi:hypothetical protein